MAWNSQSPVCFPGLKLKAGDPTWLFPGFVRQDHCISQAELEFMDILLPQLLGPRMVDTLQSHTHRGLRGGAAVPSGFARWCVAQARAGPAPEAVQRPDVEAAGSRWVRRRRYGVRAAIPRCAFYGNGRRASWRRVLCALAYALMRRASDLSHRRLFSERFVLS